MSNMIAKVLDALSRCGLLLKQDKGLPNVVSLVTGESLSASWWSHPKGRLIFAVLSELADHPDVLFTKLLYRKVTLVHRRLWPAFLTVAVADEAWQRRGLTPKARALLAKVEKSSSAVRASGEAVKALELRLLVCSEQVHTESGRHETGLESWSAWRRRLGVKPLRSAARGRQELEKAANALGAAASALPWPLDKRQRGAVSAPVRVRGGARAPSSGNTPASST
jgi:hypothetical protein